MTYIKLTNETRLDITQLDNIYRGDNLSKSITFLIPPKVEEIDVMSANVYLCYIRPDGNGDIVLLDRKKEMYNDTYHEFVLPVTCKLSRYPGNIHMWLQFMSGDFSCPKSTKSGECTIRILNSQNMDNCLDDHQITALYQINQRVAKLERGETDDDVWEDMTNNTSPDDVYDIWEDM